MSWNVEIHSTEWQIHSAVNWIHFVNYILAEICATQNNSELSGLQQFGENYDESSWNFLQIRK
jgi:hypothetical protein